MKYKLELNDEQVSTLLMALDLYSRIGIGQFQEILSWQFQWENISHEDREDIRQRLDYIKFLLTGGKYESNSYRGIWSPEAPESCKVAFDIQQVVRHCWAWTHNPKGPKGNWTVNFDEPMKGSQQPLPKCEVVEE